MRLDDARLTKRPTKGQLKASSDLWASFASIYRIIGVEPQRERLRSIFGIPAEGDLIKRSKRKRLLVEGLGGPYTVARR
jgi:hypothetical protein